MAFVLRVVHGPGALASPECFGSWWWTGRPGVLQFMELQRVRHDWATELNLTELSACKKCLPEPKSASSQGPQRIHIPAAVWECPSKAPSVTNLITREFHMSTIMLSPLTQRGNRNQQTKWPIQGHDMVKIEPRLTQASQQTFTVVLLLFSC